MTPKIENAHDYAVRCHAATNQMYGNQPYSVHLRMVYDQAVKFQHLLPFNLREVALAGCWVHDVIEDTRESYNDVKKACGEDVAEIAYALTNEKGRSREDRANDKYYKGIRASLAATFVKLCDRLANIRYSATRESRMLEVYRSEYPEFKEQLWEKKFEPMFDEMELLLEMHDQRRASQTS